nr:calcium-dependent protein kinase SK5-like [Ipomoea batatas]GMD67724.1 calcium-dependent protein kinase SK5-like [Ipomoea batatas]
MASKTSETVSRDPPKAKPTWVLPYRTQPLQQLYTIGKKLGQGHLCTALLRLQVHSQEEAVLLGGLRGRFK